MPLAVRGGILSGVSIILLAAAPFLIYRVTFGTLSPWLVGVLAAIQITAIVWVSTSTWALAHRFMLWICLLATAGVVMAMSGLPAELVGLAVSGCCHAVAYGSLLTWFVRSLRPNREPAVTGFARRIRRTMPDKVVRYTRQVTIAWCAFFAGQLILSAGLLLLMPGSVWSTFVNLLNVPLLVMMILGEFTFRLVLFRHEPRGSLMDTVSALRRARSITASRS